MILAQRLHMRYSKNGRTARRMFIAAAVLLVISGVLSLARQGEFFPSAFLCFLFAAVLLALPLFTRRSILKRYPQMPGRDMHWTYEISTDRIVARSEVASTDMLWRAIIRAQRAPEGFLLYVTDRMFQWLPIHGFHDTADVERLAQLIKANVQQYDEK